MKLNFLFCKVLLLLIVICSANGYATVIPIAVSSNFFSPSNVNANIGDTIRWNWVSGSHTTSCDGILPGTSLPPNAAPWDAQMNSGNPVFNYVVTVAGTYNYICIPHAPSMAGVITVAAGSSDLLTENFDYPAGDSLGAHGWVSFSGGSTNVLSVTSPGLVYSGYRLSNIGNATRVVNTGQDAYKNFSQPDSTGTLYCSFMVNVASAQVGDYFFAFLPPTSTTLYTSRFYAKDSAGGLSFGISKSTAGAGGIFYSPGIFSYNTTYVVVIKYQFNPGTTTDDQMSFFVFTSGIPSTEPAVPTVGPITGTANDNTLGRIALRQGSSVNAATANVDGFLVTKSWNGVATSVSNVSTSIPSGFELKQNYPNPFNPSTTIEFSIAERGFVSLKVFDMLGRIVENLVSSEMNSGTYNYNFNGSGLNSGIYFYSLEYTNGSGISYSDTKKLILLK